MIQPIVIVGTGGLAKELIAYIDSEFPRRYEAVMALSTGNWDNPRYNIPTARQADDTMRSIQWLLAIGDPGARVDMVAAHPGVRWLTYIHQSAIVSPYAAVGVGSILTPQTIVTGDAQVGRFCFMNTNATVGHDSVVGDFVTLGPNSEVCGNCHIGDICFFGIGATCLPHVTLPAGTKLSAGAIVRKSVEFADTLYGDPAAPRVRDVRKGKRAA